MTTFTTSSTSRSHLKSETSNDIYTIAVDSLGLNLSGHSSGDTLQIAGLSSDYSFRSNGGTLIIASIANPNQIITLELSKLAGAVGDLLVFNDHNITTDYIPKAGSQRASLTLTDSISGAITLSNNSTMLTYLNENLVYASMANSSTYQDNVGLNNDYVVGLGSHGLKLRGQSSGDTIHIDGLSTDYSFSSNGSRLTIASIANPNQIITLELSKLAGAVGDLLQFNNQNITADYTTDISKKHSILALTNNSNDTVTVTREASSLATLDITFNTYEDIAAPSAPTNLDLLSADDSGVFNTDNFTKNFSNLTITGLAEANAMVRIYDTNGTALLGSGTAIGGAFSIDVTLTEGSHNITARATDSANLISVSSSTLTLNVDITPPTTTTASAAYDETNNTLVITGSGFDTMLQVAETAVTDIKDRLDWSKLLWDINGDGNTTTDVTFALGDVTSAKVTDDAHLSVILTGSKGTLLEESASYGSLDGNDYLDIDSGFSKDIAGNASTTDGKNNIAVTTLTVGAPSVTEGDFGSKNMTFTLRLTSPSTQSIKIDYATLPSGSAASGSDFESTTGSITFAAGQTVAIVNIPINGDILAEGAETVDIVLSSPILAADVFATGSIMANDTPGNTVVLTAGTDNHSVDLTVFDDKINTNAPDQLSINDIITAGEGLDTLELTFTQDTALTLNDAIFTNVTGIDKIVFLSTGTGAQTISTGTEFNQAFGFAGVDLQTTSTTGAMNINMQSCTGPAALTVSSAASIAGNFISMGSGITSVSATSTTGAFTINSSASVNAKVTVTTTTGGVIVTSGSGDDAISVTTGDTAGNIISTGAGADNIDVSATTASTVGTIITGGAGADTLILTGNSSADTIVMGNEDSGITLANADFIIGFDNTIDKLRMGIVGDNTPAAGNYFESVMAVSDFANALTAANIDLRLLNGTSSAVELYSLQWDGINAYLFDDTNSDGIADQVIVLVGINGTTFDFGSIIA